MIFTKVRDLKYISEDKSFIDLLATCEEYGEIPMTLNIVDTEDYHTFLDGEKEVPLEEYCKKQKIAPYVAPVVKVIVPQSITMRQARLHLLDLGLLDDIESFISQDRRWQIEWEYATEILRDSPLIKAVQTTFNLSDEQIDNMFLEASLL